MDDGWMEGEVGGWLAGWMTKWLSRDSQERAEPSL